MLKKLTDDNSAYGRRWRAMQTHLNFTPLYSYNSPVWFCSCTVRHTQYDRPS